MGWARLRRRAHFCAEWGTDWNDFTARDLREFVFWRAEEEPIVYGGEPVAVYGVCGDAGGAHYVANCRSFERNGSCKKSLRRRSRRRLFDFRQGTIGGEVHVTV